MEGTVEEEYVKYSAKKANESDNFAARAWILTGKTLYPHNFNMQFEAYKDEKAANNFEKAAKCFSCIILGFENHPAELWGEIGELSAALRAENETTEHQEFYIRMFQLVPEEVQRKILLATANNSENNLENCKLLLLLLKRFPQTIFTHSARLLEIIIEGIPAARCKYQEMLVQEVLPLLLHKTPDISSHLVHEIFNISLEYYVQNIFEEPGTKSSVTEAWKQMVHILNLCTKTLNWLPFLQYNRNWGKDLYCQKLLQTVTTNPSTLADNSALCYGATLFLFALQEYVATTKIKVADSELQFSLVVGFVDNALSPDTQIRTNGISVSPPCSSKASVAFVTAANCWSLLNSKELKTDFTNLLRKLPLTGVINGFLFDLAVYSGRHDEAKCLLQEMDVSGLEKTLRQLVLNLMMGPITSQNFDSILNVLMDIPTLSGDLVSEVSAVYPQRHLIIMPLTRNAVLQYCTKAIIHSLKQKVCGNCPDLILGDILVLLQLDFKNERILAEEIFTIIKSKRQFSYSLFSNYLILIDFLEEFMNILYYGNFNLEFNSSHSITITRRIGTRSADKEVRDDCKQIMRQQVAKSNDDLITLVIQFITQEHAHIRNIL